MFLVLVSQAAAAAPLPPAPAAPAARCAPQTEGEIVVCGRSGPSPYRLPRVADSTKPPPRAEVQVAEGVQVAANVESGGPPGTNSSRVMLKLKIKF